MDHRCGMALPVAVLLLLGMTILGHGALLLSRYELRATLSFRDRVRAQRAAEVGLRLHWPPSSGPAASGESGDWILEATRVLPGGLSYKISRRWLDDEFFLLSGIGQGPGPAGMSRIVWLGRRKACEAGKEASGS